jgi:hypothetical protein
MFSGDDKIVSELRMSTNRPYELPLFSYLKRGQTSFKSKEDGDTFASQDMSRFHKQNGISTNSES